jgi:hypothetical protein
MSAYSAAWPHWLPQDVPHGRTAFPRRVRPRILAADNRRMTVYIDFG